MITTTSPVYTGSKLRSLLDERPVNITKLAQQVGVSRQWLYDIMSNDRTIDAELADRLADRLGIDLTSLES